MNAYDSIQWEFNENELKLIASGDTININGPSSDDECWRFKIQDNQCMVVMNKWPQRVGKIMAKVTSITFYKSSAPFVMHNATLFDLEGRLGNCKNILVCPKTVKIKIDIVISVVWSSDNVRILDKNWPQYGVLFE